MLKNKIKNYIKRFRNKFIYSQRAEYLKNCALNYKEEGITKNKYCENEIIVSLTTFGKRYYEVYLAVESIMQGNVKPNKIILWLSEEEFSNTEFPLILKNQQKRGLEIRYCKDILSYKKLIPALKEFPSSVIITIDDDNLYQSDLIENLINEHIKNPGLILCTRLHRIKLKNKNTLLKYSKWTWRYTGLDISPLNFPIGGGGVLYPPGSLNPEVFNEAVFMDICRYADDIWFKAMSLLNNVQCKKIPTRDKHGKDDLSNESVQDVSLNRINVKKSLNDIQIKNVFDKYNLYERLSNG